MKSGIVLLFLCALGGFAPAQKPDVWIITDMSDKTLPGKNKEGTINDPDDISTLAAYLLMANHFNTKGIVVASTHRMEHRSTPNQAEWAKRIWETAYAADLPHLNRNIGGYPDSIPFLQSAIKESGEKYDPTRKYIDLSGYPSIKALMDAVLSQEEPLYILCWGSLTEPAIFVNHCLNTRRPDLLKRVRFIGHWTNSGLHQGTPEEPWKVANCNEDQKACEYIKSQAKARQITYYECGAIGQHGIVSGGHFGKAYFERFRKSKLGTLFAEGKFVFNGVDFSDAATFWVLLGNWGVSLADLSPNGVNTMELEKRNEQTFQEWSRQIHDELLNRALSAQPAPKSFRNPVIPGFHPDPSICRVGEDYYLVNSSFEFFPGLPIFHSTDLVHWNLIGYGITRPDQVPLPVGLPDSRGIYAPAIRYKDGTFYVVTTCVNCNGNFYITAKDPAGPWSDPQWLPKASGIDPTLFWDSDGKCYYVGHGKINGPKEWPNQEGVWIQELDLKTNTLLGEKKQITHGHASNARWTEGPHLYKIDGKYLLVAAEGGTGFHHAVTVFHSDSIYGPYIPDHSNPVLTHRNLGQGYPVHATGHADLVQTQHGDWWSVMLAKRRNKEGQTLLGRETFLTPVAFQDGTPVFNPGVGRIQMEATAPNLKQTIPAYPQRIDDFSGNSLDLHWNMVRSPSSQWYALNDGNLVLQVRPEVADSLSNPSMLIRRIENDFFEAHTKLSFSPNREESAGMILYRSSTNYFQLVREGSKVKIIKKQNGQNPIELANASYEDNELVLGVRCETGKLFFYFGKSKAAMELLGSPQSVFPLTDESASGFTGPFVGLYATSKGLPSSNHAAFDWFEYHELDTTYSPETLPDYMTRLTDFGERAAWSPDGMKIAFLNRTYGDVYEIDLQSRAIRPITHHFPHYGFQRVHYLANGDYLLTGANFFDAANPGKARRPENCQVWILKKDLSGPPIPLGITIKEGIAVARNELRIAWVIDPDLFIADIEYREGLPVLTNHKKCLSESDLPEKLKGWHLEPQDFRPPFENELLFNAHFPINNHVAEVMGLNTTTGKISNYSMGPERYDEPEGVFPDGSAILVESNRHHPAEVQDIKNWNLIDLYKLPLDGSGELQRITYFNDAMRYKASNPVVSPDGKFIAFQYAETTEITGKGHGIILLDLSEFKRMSKK